MTVENPYWQCPHCFFTLPWSDKAGIEAHTCEDIVEVTRITVRGSTVRLTKTIEALKNPNPKRRKRKT